MSSLFDFNDVTISGNLIREPKLRQLDSSTTLCSIRIAHNERRKTPAGEWIDHPQYFNATLWTSLAEWTARNVQKGEKVVINGRLHWSEYQTADEQVRQTVDSDLPLRLTATQTLQAPDINANSLIHIPHPQPRRTGRRRGRRRQRGRRARRPYRRPPRRHPVLTHDYGPSDQGGPPLGPYHQRRDRQKASRSCWGFVLKRQSARRCPTKPGTEHWDYAAIPAAGPPTYSTRICLAPRPPSNGRA
jgi:single stranded DNA-binding protein